jgi:hypothetical protein
MDFEDPPLTGLGISVDLLVVFLLNKVDERDDDWVDDPNFWRQLM